MNYKKKKNLWKWNWFLFYFLSSLWYSRKIFSPSRIELQSCFFLYIINKNGEFRISFIDLVHFLGINNLRTYLILFIFIFYFINFVSLTKILLYFLLYSTHSHNYYIILIFINVCFEFLWNGIWFSLFGYSNPMCYNLYFILDVLIPNLQCNRF